MSATVELRGITWDHPRGYAPLEELARLDAAGETPYGAVPAPIRWDRQPLEGFESTPIAELARTYDIMIVDHPGLGAAIGAGALAPMDELFPAAELDAWRAGTVGPSYASYSFDGRAWALPLDAATQVSAARPEAVPDPPRTWDEVRELAREAPVALCLGGPHAYLMYSALRVEREDPAEALDLMAALLGHADPGLSARNPIAVLGAMAAPGGPAYCPLVYGYVTYSSQAGNQGPLAFHDAPAWTPGGRPGSVLGGTGLAVSRRRLGDPGVADAVRAHLRRLMSEPVQRRLFPETGGQPAARAAWLDPEVNARTGGFYRDTLATVEAAWVRPRSPGYIAFQDAASRVLREGLLARAPHRAILDELGRCEEEWRTRCASR
ncbi:multiple sugar transport system substrate-binding protein [Thermocatellispora tengchongensis]|uniref:Multiple sugar transport system substrate-binding protein n=1 Tax=Thermocatellispora tengchongensis TaxID=1073253 RepID=A0A840NYM1_9ACTN|nr:extracellular solute-binding protein [Thermocatellispora tengchongensis]MBB5131306.1 multiple sugar transport system substrate-binding protein [Thermocatellispora tengchongensis]